MPNISHWISARAIDAHVSIVPSDWRYARVDWGVTKRVGNIHMGSRARLFTRRLSQ
jgi:hypothetical protein